jgi:hypothetical protein
MTSAHPQSFFPLQPLAGAAGSVRPRTGRRALSPAAAMAALVASSFAVWLSVLLLLLT